MIDRLRKHKLNTGDDGSRLWLAGKAMPDMIDTLRAADVIMTLPEQQKLLELLKTYAALMKPFESEALKLHLMVHAVLCIPMFGNLLYYSL